jgi:membrane protein
VTAHSALQFLKRLYQRTTAAALSRSAAQLAFFSLFALFPFLLILISLAGYLPVEGVAEALLARARQVLPSDGYAIIDSHVNEVIAHRNPRLLSLGFVLTVWSSTRAIDALRVALNRAHGVQETRPLWKRELLALGMTLLLAALLIASSSLMLLGSRAGGWLALELGAAGQFGWIWPTLRWPLILLVVLLGLALCYWLVPDVKHPLRLLSPGSVVAMVVWFAATFAFSKYLELFDRFNLAYGSIGGVLILLMWLYLSGFTIVIGGEIDALLQTPASHPTEADEQPIAET